VVEAAAAVPNKAAQMPLQMRNNGGRDSTSTGRVKTNNTASTPRLVGCAQPSRLMDQCITSRIGKGLGSLASKVLEEEKKLADAKNVDLNDTIDLLIEPTVPGLKMKITEVDDE
jgi:hypothetical protein